MRTVSLSLCALLALTPVAAVELSDEEATLCRSEGGCIVITRDRLLKLIKDTETAACRGKT